MNKHLELLQWCIDNESKDFPVMHSFNIGKSWIHALNGDLIFQCVEEDDIDEVIFQLSAAKAGNTPESIKAKRKQALLKELAELDGE